MCGLVGIAGKLEYRDEATIKKLLVFDVFRGPDSTGLATVRGKACKIAKVASHPWNLFDTKRFAAALQGFGADVFLGHNRLATKGSINDHNAHPYQFGNIVGAHNGTLSHTSWEELEKVLDEKFEVDSMAVIAAIDRLGIEAVVPMLQGAWALTWVNIEEGTINFLRNKERPLWYAMTEDYEKIFWASEWPIIRATIDTSTSEYKLDQSKDGFTYFQFPENVWHKFTLQDFYNAKQNKKRPKATVKELKGKEPAPVSYYGGNGHTPFTGKKSDGKSHSTSLTTTTWPKGGGADAGYDFTTGGGAAAFGYKGVKKFYSFDPWLSRPNFETIARHGCSWCGGELNHDEPGTIIFVEEDTCLCNKCSGTETTRLYVDPSVPVAPIKAYTKQ